VKGLYGSTARVIVNGLEPSANLGIGCKAADC